MITDMKIEWNKIWGNTSVEEMAYLFSVGQRTKDRMVQYLYNYNGNGPERLVAV